MENKKIRQSTLKKLNNVFEYLLNNSYSNFYERKYKKFGINFKKITTPKQFYSLPLLSKEEILGEKPYDFLFFPKEKVRYVSITSGTTNQQNPLLILSSREYDSKKRDLRNQIVLDLNIKSIMHLHSTPNIIARYSLNNKLINKGVLNVVGDINNLQLSAKIAARLEIEAIQTTSTILYFFIPYLKKEYDLSKIRLLLLGGEYTSEQKYKHIQKMFKNAYVKFSFGGAETGLIGYRCEYLAKEPPRFFHPSKNLYVEILNPDRESELVITSLEKGKQPFVIRYKTGNSAKIINQSCPCKETEIIEMYGKIGLDVLSVSGTFIYSKNIYNCLIPYSKLLESPDFRLHVYEKTINHKIMTKLVLQVVSKNDLGNSEEAKETIKKGVSDKLLLTTKNTLSDLVQKKIFMPLEVQFIESLPFSTKQTNIISHII